MIASNNTAMHAGGTSDLCNAGSKLPLLIVLSINCNQTLYISKHEKHPYLYREEKSYKEKGQQMSEPGVTRLRKHPTFLVYKRTRTKEKEGNFDRQRAGVLVVVAAAALVRDMDIALADLTGYTLGSRSNRAHGNWDTASADRPSSLAVTDDSALSATTRRNRGWGSTRNTSGGKTDERSAPGGSRRSRHRRRRRRRGGGSSAGARCGVIARNNCDSGADDLRAGVLVFDGNNTLGDGAAVAGVRTEQVRKSIETGLGGLSTTDGNSSTLHVHLSVSKTVEPGPCNNGLAGGEVRGNLEVEKRQGVLTIGRFKVTSSLDWMVSLPRGHDSPPGGLGRIGVISD